MKKFTNFQKDCMKKLYINKLYSVTEIANIFNCITRYIYKILNIKSTLNKNNTNDLSNNQIVLNKNDINDLPNNNSNICLINNIKNE